MISLTSWVSRAASPCIRVGEPADRLGVVAGVQHGLGEQRQRADRGLELVADVGDEVAAYVVDAAGLGAVLDQQQDVRAAQRRDPGADDEPAATQRPAGQLELDLPDLPVRGAPGGPGRPARRGSARRRGPDRRRTPSGWP